ncbi:MAG: hypothetical protein Tsb009_11230 [Planctomycetaceae bacterium]
MIFRNSTEKSERRIYVPYRSWQSLYHEDEPTIFLPYSEYRQLVQEAKQGKIGKSDAPPVRAVIIEAHYSATVEKGLARISARLKIKSLVNGWVELPLAFSGAAIGKMTCSDENAILRGIAEGQYSLLLSRQGTHSLELDLSVKVNESSAGKQIEWGCPSVGISTVEMSVSRPDQSISITPGLVELPATAFDPKKITRKKVNVGAAKRISVSWTSQRKTPIVKTALATARQLSHMTIRDGILLNETTLTYEVRRGAFSELQFAVPLSDRLLSVTGPVSLVTGWSVAKQANQQRVTVSLSKPVSGQIAIQVRSERTLKTDEVSLAGADEEGTPQGVQAVNVVRSSGFVVIEHDDTVTLDVKRQTGWLRGTALDIPANHRRKNAVYYRFFQLKTPLTVTIHPVKPRITAAQDAQLTFSEKGSRQLTVIDYRIQRVGIFELQIQLPAGFQVDNVVTGQLKEFTVEDVDDHPTLRIFLTKRISGSHRVTVTGHRDLDVANRDKPRAVPVLKPLKTDLESGRLLFYAPRSLAIVVDPETLVGVQAAALTSTHRKPDVRLVSAWEYHRRPIRMNVKVQPVPTRLTARVATEVKIRETSTQVRTGIEYSIEHSPVKQFHILVPQPVIQTLRIRDEQGNSVPFQVGKVNEAKQGPAAKPPQKNQKPDSTEQDWSVATIVLAKPAIGRKVFRLSYEIPVPAEVLKTASSSKRELTLSPVRIVLKPSAGFVAVSELLGEVVIAAQPTFKVSVSSTGGDVETIDSRELQLVSEVSGNFFRYHKEPVSFSIQTVKLSVQPVVQTVISKALVEMLIGADQTATYRCRFQLVTSERQRLQVDLPKPAEPLVTLVNGKKVDLEVATADLQSKKEEFATYLLNVTRTESSNRPLHVTLQFRMPISPEPFASPFGKIRLFLPRLGGQNRVVQQLRTVLWIPREFALVGKVENFQRRTQTKLTGLLPNHFRADVQTDELQKWIEIDPGGFDFPTEGHAYRFDNLGGNDKIEVTYAKIAFATWWLSVPLLLIGFVLAKTTWENKLAIVLVLGFVITLFSLEDSDWVYHGLMIARYGLAAMFIWWVIHAIFGKHTSVPNGGPLNHQGDHSDHPPHSPPLLPATAVAVIPPPGAFDEIEKFFQ